MNKEDPNKIIKDIEYISYNDDDEGNMVKNIKNLTAPGVHSAAILFCTTCPGATIKKPKPTPHNFSSVLVNLSEQEKDDEGNIINPAKAYPIGKVDGIHVILHPGQILIGRTCRVCGGERFGMA